MTAAVRLARYVTFPDPEALAAHCLLALAVRDPEFARVHRVTLAGMVIPVELEPLKAAIVAMPRRSLLAAILGREMTAGQMRLYLDGAGVGQPAGAVVARTASIPWIDPAGDDRLVVGAAMLVIESLGDPAALREAFLTIDRARARMPWPEATPAGWWCIFKAWCGKALRSEIFNPRKGSRS